MIASAGIGGEAALAGDVSRPPQFILRNDVQIVYITRATTREARILELPETLRDSTVSTISCRTGRSRT